MGVAKRAKYSGGLGARIRCDLIAKTCAELGKPSNTEALKLSDFKLFCERSLGVIKMPRN